MAKSPYYLVKSFNEYEMLIQYLDKIGINVGLYCKNKNPNTWEEFPCLLFDKYEKIVGYTGNGDNSNRIEITTVSEFLDAVLNPPLLRYELNKTYEAIIDKNGDVKIGCQSFTKEQMTNFITTYNNFINK